MIRANRFTIISIIAAIIKGVSIELFISGNLYIIKRRKKEMIKEIR